MAKGVIYHKQCVFCSATFFTLNDQKITCCPECARKRKIKMTNQSREARRKMEVKREKESNKAFEKRIPCLRCSTPFMSRHYILNRICQKCTESNKDIANRYEKSALYEIT